jgi:hypothetical protein
MHTEKSFDGDASDESAESSGCLPREQAKPVRPQRQLSAALVSTIEGEIVPRLLMLSRAASAARARPEPPASSLEPADVEELARLLVRHGSGIACEFVETIRQRGTPYDQIYLQLLSPTARHLVDLWEQQDCSYPELTDGLSALHAVVIKVSGAARSAHSI